MLGSNKLNLSKLKTALVLTLFATTANALCPEHDMSGTYTNRRGERFKIDQPNCDLAIVTDIQQNRSFDIKFGGAQNLLSVSTLTSFDGNILGSPITYTANYTLWGVELDFQSHLNIAGNPRLAKLDTPLLKLKMTITRDPGYMQYAPQLGYVLHDLKVAVPSNSGALNEFFARGINLGVTMMHRVFGKSEYMREYLNQVE